MSKIKIGGLKQYDAEPFEQEYCGTAGVEGVNWGQLRAESSRIVILLQTCRSLWAVFQTVWTA